MSDVWELLTQQDPLPWQWVVLGAATGILIVLLPPLWRLGRHILTVAHESGHAIMGMLVGRKLQGLRLHTDSSGATTTAGTHWGLGGVLTTAAGYPFPGLVAAGVVAVGAAGYARLGFIAMAAVLLLLLVKARSVWTVLLLLTSCAALGGVAVYAPVAGVSVVTGALVAVLVVGTQRTLLEERPARRGGAESDVWVLGQRTALPAGVWWVLLSSATWVPLGVLAAVTLNA